MENICPKCKSKNISLNTIFEEEKRKTGEGCFLGYIVMVLLIFIPVFGWLLLFAIYNEKRKSVPVTHALCVKCGYRWKLQTKKKNRKLFIISVLLIVFTAIAFQIYFMGKYQMWF